MRKRPVALLFSLAVLAAIPATAFGSPVLRESGFPVAAGATVQATNVGSIVRTSIFNLNCNTSLMHGDVAANTGSQVEIEITSVAFGDCTGQGGDLEAKNLPWCWRSTKTADAFELRGGKCAEAAKPITLVAGGCPYTRSSMVGTFPTSPEQLATKMLEQEFKSETSGFCPTTFRLDVTYAFETAASPFTVLSIS